MEDKTKPVIDTELQILTNNKESGFNFRERRQAEWDENYTLYRDRVVLNRLTQRQSVNLPIMKQTIKTLLKDIDDMPVIEFENLDNDKQAEVFQNEYWNHCVEHNKMEILDVIDKKQVMMFGRTFDQWQIEDGKITMTIIDPEDILIDRYVRPEDINSARFLIHTHIFKTLSQLKKSKIYDQDKIKELETWYKSQEGIVKSADNMAMLERKNAKLRAMGVTDVDDPILGETYIELSMHFVYDNKKDSEEEELFLKVEADDMKILLNKPLEEIYGVTKDHYFKTHFPYNSWAEDIDNQDFWVDGVADLVRPSNKVLNAWISQLVENRTLRNLNMNLFDSNIDGYVPQTWEPRAWGMYGVPVPQGKSITDVFHQMPVADLSESLDEMQFVIGIIEKASGATATQQGAQTERSVTLGEVELALGEAKERVKGMSKFYTQVWKERANLFLKLIEGNQDKLDYVKIFKKGRNSDKIYSREIAPKDYTTPTGYRTKIWSRDDKEAENSQKIERINASVIAIPGNQVLLDIYQRKLLEFSGLTPEEIAKVMEFEKQKREALQLQAMGGMMNGGNPAMLPGGAPSTMMPQAPQLQAPQQPTL